MRSGGFAKYGACQRRAGRRRRLAQRWALEDRTGGCPWPEAICGDRHDSAKRLPFGRSLGKPEPEAIVPRPYKRRMSWAAEMAASLQMVVRFGFLGRCALQLGKRLVYAGDTGRIWYTISGDREAPSVAPSRIPLFDMEVTLFCSGVPMQSGWVSSGEPMPSPASRISPYFPFSGPKGSFFGATVRTSGGDVLVFSRFERRVPWNSAS